MEYVKKSKFNDNKINQYKDDFKKKRFRKINEKSCGCIIIKNGKVLLIQQKRGNWGFPKGHVEFNETEIQTAKREVKEETNLDVRIFKNRRYSEKFFSKKGKIKQVVYFLAKQTGGIEKKQDSEIKAMKWVEFDEALKKITYFNTKQLFKKVLNDMK